jgi:hypothetical protein
MISEKNVKTTHFQLRTKKINIGNENIFHGKIMMEIFHLDFLKLFFYLKIIKKNLIIFVQILVFNISRYYYQKF